MEWNEERGSLTLLIYFYTKHVTAVDYTSSLRKLYLFIPLTVDVFDFFFFFLFLLGAGREQASRPRDKNKTNV